MTGRNGCRVKEAALSCAEATTINGKVDTNKSHRYVNTIELNFVCKVGVTSMDAIELLCIYLLASHFINVIAIFFHASSHSHKPFELMFWACSHGLEKIGKTHAHCIQSMYD